jgi:hypothetical protein
LGGRGDDGSVAFYRDSKEDSVVGFGGKGVAAKARVRVGSSSDSSSSAPHVQDKVTDAVVVRARCAADSFGADADA